MATGVFDLLHPGHVAFLREAKALGDELVVVVARDSTAKRFKHTPITPEAQRLEMVAALKPVDRAVLGNEGDIFEILDEIRPDVIALGYDQIHNEEKIAEESRRRGLARTKVVRLPKFEGDLDGTRKIVQRVADWLALNETLSKVEKPIRRRKA
jgi:FAD synthetase